MSSITRPKRSPRDSNSSHTTLPPLEPGDHLDQKTFHARYEAMSEQVRAELIGGVVYMPSPLKRPHGKMHLKLARWLAEYEEATPGTEGFDAVSTILSRDSEPQPDLCLLIDPDHGGQTREKDHYIVGSPELIAEVASSTESHDLHSKKRDYQRVGVKEYLVVALRQRRVFWFVRRRGKFQEMSPRSDGILCSEVFPGLWLDPAALLRGDSKRVMQVLRQGVASPEHAAFVAKLAGT